MFDLVFAENIRPVRAKATLPRSPSPMAARHFLPMVKDWLFQNENPIQARVDRVDEGRRKGVRLYSVLRERPESRFA